MHDLFGIDTSVSETVITNTQHFLDIEDTFKARESQIYKEESTKFLRLPTHNNTTANGETIKSVDEENSKCCLREVCNDFVQIDDLLQFCQKLKRKGTDQSS